MNAQQDLHLQDTPNLPNLMSALKNFATRLADLQTDVERLERHQARTAAEAEQLRAENRRLLEGMELLETQNSQLQKEQEEREQLTLLLMSLVERSHAIVADAVEITGDVEYEMLLADYQKILMNAPQEVVTEASAVVNQPQASVEHWPSPSSGKIEMDPWLKVIEAAQNAAV